MKIILGSSSRFRKRVLKDAGYVFEVMAPDIDEKSIRSEDYHELPLLIAREKMNALKEKVDDPSIIITSDQIVVCDGELREKAVSEEQVFSFFEKYNSGFPAETITAVVVFNTANNKSAEGIDVAKIYFDPVPEEDIRRYIDSGEALFSAGAFDHENENLSPYVKKIEGSSDSISGMPLGLFRRLLEEVG